MIIEERGWRTGLRYRLHKGGLTTGALASVAMPQKWTLEIFRMHRMTFPVEHTCDPQ